MSLLLDISNWRETKKARGRNSDNYFEVGYGYFSRRYESEATPTMRDKKKSVVEAIRTMSGMGHFGRDFIFGYLNDNTFSRRLKRKEQLRRRIRALRTIRQEYGVPAVFLNPSETFPRDPFTKYVGQEIFKANGLTFPHKVTILATTGEFLNLVARENRREHRDLWTAYPESDPLETHNEPFPHTFEFMRAADMVELRMRNEIIIRRVN